MTDSWRKRRLSPFFSDAARCHTNALRWIKTLYQHVTTTTKTCPKQKEENQRKITVTSWRKRRALIVYDCCTGPYQGAGASPGAGAAAGAVAAPGAGAGAAGAIVRHAPLGAFTEVSHTCCPVPGAAIACCACASAAHTLRPGPCVVAGPGAAAGATCAGGPSPEDAAAPGARAAACAPGCHGGRPCEAGDGAGAGTSTICACCTGCHCCSQRRSWSCS